jgi:3-deoxy-7-phosphoheptulonate synthase
VTTTGNPDGHLVLRGGKHGPNYDITHVEQAANELAELGLNPRMMVDCSHANSQKDHRKQLDVLDNIAEQVKAGQPSHPGRHGGKSPGGR